MDKDDDPWEILGVPRDASEADIKKAFRKGALRYHPDRQQTEQDKVAAHDIFAKLSAARDTVTDPVKRYDWKLAEEKRTSSNPVKPTTTSANSDVKKQPMYSPCQTTTTKSTTPLSRRRVRARRPTSSTTSSVDDPTNIPRSTESGREGPTVTPPQRPSMTSPGPTEKQAGPSPASDKAYPPTTSSTTTTTTGGPRTSAAVWSCSPCCIQDMFCSRCGRDSHSVKDCYARTNRYGQALDSYNSGCYGYEPRSTRFYSGGGACYRCGRSSHYANDCYARTHINGFYL